jgi:hypothetical protein
VYPRPGRDRWRASRKRLRSIRWRLASSNRSPLPR